MGLAEIYCNEIHDNLRPLYGNWHPGTPVGLGDYGELRNGVFVRLGNIRDLRVAFSVRDDPTQDQITFSSQGKTEVTLAAAGAVATGMPVTVKASIDIAFGSEKAVFFNASKCKYITITDLVALGKEIMRLFESDSWDRSWSIVTQVVEAASTTVVVSGSSSASVRLEALGDVPNINLADASVKLGVATSKNVGLTIAAQDGLSPLIGLSKIQPRWLIFGHTLKPMRSSVGRETVETLLNSRMVKTENSKDELFFGQLP